MRAIIEITRMANQPMASNAVRNRVLYSDWCDGDVHEHRKNKEKRLKSQDILRNECFHRLILRSHRCNACVIRYPSKRASKVGIDALSKLQSRKQAVMLNNIALGVYPFGLSQGLCFGRNRGRIRTALPPCLICWFC
jgi:hypothetical protein